MATFRVNIFFCWGTCFGVADCSSTPIAGKVILVTLSFTYPSVKLFLRFVDLCLHLFDLFLPGNIDQFGDSSLRNSGDHPREKTPISPYTLNASHGRDQRG
jgi:hypothetical protein